MMLRRYTLFTFAAATTALVNCNFSVSAFAERKYKGKSKIMSPINTPLISHRVLPRPLCHGRSISLKAEGDNIESDGNSLQDVLKSIDFGRFVKNTDQIRANILDGEIGQRGEAYVIAQAVLFLGIFLGFVPFAEDAINIFLGPILFIAGFAVAVVSVFGLGKSLSPWPVVVDEEKSDGLVTTGLYGQIRHPIYAGAIMIGVGLSVITHSATRLLLTAFLLYLFDIKSDYEEKSLQTAFPSYNEYKEKVPSKFIPKSLLGIMYGEKNEG